MNKLETDDSSDILLIASPSKSETLITLIFLDNWDFSSFLIESVITSSLSFDFSIAWICGIISKVKFFQVAKLKEAGTKTNNFTYDQSRYEVQYKDLGDMYRFLDWHNEINKVIS